MAIQTALQAPDPKHHFLGASQLLVNRGMAVTGFYENDERTLLAASKQYVRVLGGVATFCNDSALLRIPCSVPDGLYNIVSTGEFEPAQPKHKVIYPDVDLLKPPPTIPVLAQLPKESLGRLFDYFSKCTRDDSVVLETGGIWLQSNSNHAMAFNFGLPKPVVLNSTYLKIGLLELSKRCDIIYVYRDIQDEKACVIFGTDWAHCFMLAPIVRGW
jgi:hypothetical protein